MQKREQGITGVFVVAVAAEEKKNNWTISHRVKFFFDISYKNSHFLFCVNFWTPLCIVVNRKKFNLKFNKNKRIINS